MYEELKRRHFLRQGGLLGLSAIVATQAKATSGVLTPPQTEGPFYPVRDQQDKDLDLTLVEGRSERAQGEVVVVHGTVYGADGRPLSGAVIDVWQACHTGAYDHPRDPNPAPRDPNFQYFARLLTNNDGEYRFRTIIPGAYPANENWQRPPHIHFRVDAWGKARLTTQMYFKGHALNAEDHILRDTARRFGRPAMESLIVDFSGSRDRSGVAAGRFDLRIGRTPQVD